MSNRHLTRAPGARSTRVSAGRVRRRGFHGLVALQYGPHFLPVVLNPRPLPQQIPAKSSGLRFKKLRLFHCPIPKISTVGSQLHGPLPASRSHQSSWAIETWLMVPGLGGLRRVASMIFGIWFPGRSQSPRIRIPPCFWSLIWSVPFLVVKGVRNICFSHGNMGKGGCPGGVSRRDTGRTPFSTTFSQGNLL